MSNREFNPFEFEQPQRHNRVEQEVVHMPPAADSEPESTDPNSAADSEQQLKEERRRLEAEQRRRRLEKNPFWQFATGGWLITESIADTYRYLLIVATMLFLSMVSIFISFHLDEKFNRHSSQTQLLRERSLDYQKLRFEQTSHSAIVRELKARNIPLYESGEARIIIED